MSMILDGSNGVTFNDASLQGAAASPYVLKNRIINGDMRIDQRNAGASVTPTLDQTYTVDRWAAGNSAASKYSVQQNAGSVTPPAGFTNYLGITSTSAYSVLASDYFYINQRIEGYNVSDLAYGTASAKTVTLSFWVRSSLTGTFGGSLFIDPASKSYPFSYTISAANTWELKSVTIAGNTANALATTNGLGILVAFGLGVGSTYSAAAGSWQSGLFLSATGATSVVGTNGATFYITGVQLEQNTSATPFERRLYGQELINCQRYLPAYNGTGAIAAGFCSGTTQAFANVVFPVITRVAPTGITVSNATHFSVYNSGAAAIAGTVVSFSTASLSSALIGINTASGLVAGNGTILTANNAAAQLLFTGCEL